MSNRFIAVFLSVLVVLVAPAYAQNQTQTQPQTPQMQPSFELSNNVSTLLRAIMTEELSDVDRSMLISELEQAIQSFLTDTVNVEFGTRDDGNEKVLTITTASALAETPEEQREEDNSVNYFVKLHPLFFIVILIHIVSSSNLSTYIFSPSVYILRLSPFFNFIASTIFLGIVIIIGGLSPLLAGLEFTTS